MILAPYTCTFSLVWLLSSYHKVQFSTHCCDRGCTILRLQTLFKTLKAVSHKTKKEHLSRYQISSNAKKPKDNCTNNHESTVPRIAKSTKDQDKLVLSDLYFSLFFSVNINICYSPREVRIEKNCARGLAYRPKR